jgi:hypothetical protein
MMARIHLILDVTAEPSLWDPHELIEDILVHADELPTFEPGLAWFIASEETIEGTFVSCYWEDE